MKEIGSIEIVKYYYAMFQSEPKIIIQMVKLLDKEGKYIKFAPMSEAIDLLSKYPVKFNELER